jgi:hypothetical protein
MLLVGPPQCCNKAADAGGRPARHFQLSTPGCVDHISFSPNIHWDHNKGITRIEQWGVT